MLMMSDLNQAPSEQAIPQLPEVSTAGMQTNYSNMVRGFLTAEEITLDFGFNPSGGGAPLEERPAIHSRIVLGFPSAVRLYQLLHALLAKRQEAVNQAAAHEQSAKSGEVKVFGATAAPSPE